MRDLREVGAKLKLVVLPRMSQAGVLDRLKEWDLWGPLAVCLTLSISLCITAPESQRALVFAAVFFVIWVGAAIVTLNAQLLGGKISFFQSVCVLGYSVFPLNIAALVCLLMNLISNSGILRLFIAIYPVFGFYGFIAWMILIQ